MKCLILGLKLHPLCYLVFLLISPSSSANEGRFIVRPVTGVLSRHLNASLVHNGRFYFPGLGANGVELYQTDGITVDLVADIMPGSESSDPYGLTSLGTDVLFSANGIEGLSLYKTDGVTVTRIGDVPIRINSYSCGINNSAEFRGEVYYSGIGPNGTLLYKTDGATITLVDDILEPIGFTEYKNELYFQGMTDNGTWRLCKTDGATTTEFDIYSPAHFTEFNDDLFFQASGPQGLGVYKSDGDTVTYVPDVPSAVSVSLSFTTTEFNGELYFAGDGPHGYEPFKFDGHTLVELADIFPGPKSSSPQFVTLGNDLLFVARHSFTPYNIFGGDPPPGPDSAIYATDGESITRLATLPMPVKSSSFAELDGHLFINATWELYDSVAGQLIMWDGDTVSSFDVHFHGEWSETFTLVPFNEELYFVGTLSPVLPRGQGAVGELFRVSQVSAIADFNVDGHIDEQDLLVLEANFGMLTGATRVDGDADGDGDVDGTDYAVW